MIEKNVMSLEEIRITGLKVLHRELGPVGLVRFLQLFNAGYGDYTKDRDQWLDQISLDDLLKNQQLNVRALQD